MPESAIRSMQVPASEYVFDVDVAGELGEPVVLLLHGFPQTSHTYRDLLPALADAGYLAVAPNQRGYSPGARPADVADYGVQHLTADAIAIATEFGGSRFHLVGHDWGGQLAWLIAAAQPERLHSLSVLSRPHPAAFAAAMKNDAAQSDRSRHHRAYNDPNTAALLLEDDARRLRRGLEKQAVPARDIDAYLSRLKEPAALEAALQWYRAAQSGGKGMGVEIPAVQVATLYVWGDADAAVGRAAAEATAAHVKAPYRFEAIAGAGHFLTDDAGAKVTSMVLEHIRQYSG
jgi:pimeloyl-ACP methyl ester carboxylesterase